MTQGRADYRFAEKLGALESIENVEMDEGTRQPLAHHDPRVTPLTLDVTDAAQIQAAPDQAGSLDILVNNAGVALYDDLSDRAMLERHLTVILFGTHDVTQAFLPALTRSRGPSSTTCR